MTNVTDLDTLKARAVRIRMDEDIKTVDREQYIELLDLFIALTEAVADTRRNLIGDQR